MNFCKGFGTIYAKDKRNVKYTTLAEPNATYLTENLVKNEISYL